MKGQHAHADGALLLRGQFPERANIQLGADIELAPSFIKHLLDGPAFMLMLLTMLVLTFLVAIPNALAPIALLEGVTLLSARRAQLVRGLVFLGGVLIMFGFNFSFRAPSQRQNRAHQAKANY